MEVKVERPPNFERILEVFPRAREFGVIFAYGDTIYNPSGVGIPTPLRVHEEVHGKRQRGAGVDAWWDAYLTDPAFRFTEELKAHVAEYNARVTLSTDRYAAARLKAETARRLIAPLYAYGLAQPSFQEALNAIQTELVEVRSLGLKHFDPTLYEHPMA